MKSTTTKIFFLLLFFWIALAGFNVLYNVVKTADEVKEWAFLTDNQKRYKIFGELHDFFSFIDKNTQQDSQILIYSKDIKTFYLSKYYLYPHKVESTGNIQELQQFIESGKYLYVALDNVNYRPKGYKLVSSKLSKPEVEFFLYKKYE